MNKKILTIQILLLLLLSSISHAHETRQSTAENIALQTGKFIWMPHYNKAILKPVNTGGENWISVKDPSIVEYKDRWHLFCTVRGQKRSHAIVYLSFDSLYKTLEADQHILTCHDGYFCAPQVFYFKPHKKWYLICQASDESWQPKYQPAFSTTTEISDPNSWAKLKPLGAKQADGKSGLDFWIICDDTKAHLFFTTLDGRMWREETALDDFPHGWSAPSLAIQGDIFEASHTYKLIDKDLYLTIVEAQNGHGWRYYKAYLADTLDGQWRPLAAEKDKAFASMKNTYPDKKRWTDSISHGELIRAGYDQRLEVSTQMMKFLFQGVSDTKRRGKDYGQIPWRLGLLHQVPTPPPKENIQNNSP